MSTENDLHARSGGVCEFCGGAEALAAYEVPPTSDGTAEQSVLGCGTCRAQMADASAMDARHWLCLNETMWSQVPAVQVMAWRMLTRLSNEVWAHDLLEMLYLDEATQAWAQAGGDEPAHAEGASTEGTSAVVHRDSNGAVLAAGDTITLIKDLNVKGAGFTAKRGTAVRGITLVADNPEHIEGRINGQRIVILTQFVKKS